MSTIKLCDLFERVDSGGALVALDVNGNFISINQVSSGLACNCSCPGCGRRLIAKKGAVQAHHFAHYAEALQDACTSAGESALHRFAKDILAERREISLPLRGEQARSAARKHQENEERERRTRKEREEEAAARLSTLQALALEILGESAEAWLNSSMARLQGRSPVSATRDGDDGYGEAIRELNRWNRELDIKRQAEASKRLAVRRLHEAVQSRLDEALVDAWMRGKHPGLNGLSPIEFTVDDTTCNKCISLLDSTRRRRR